MNEKRKHQGTKKNQRKTKKNFKNETEINKKQTIQKS